MTSKEEIEKLDYILTLHLNDKGMELWSRIKKDLEILEIIKENMTIDDWENVRVKTNADWNKVMEWLDNE